MPGIAQVWLTHDELEALATALDRLAFFERTRGAHPPSKTLTAAQTKIEAALAPVACQVASGPKAPPAKHIHPSGHFCGSNCPANARYRA